jgi:hypothetical protein
MHVSRSKIRVDLALLAGRYDCVRTYTAATAWTRCRLAAEFGRCPRLAWIGRDPLLSKPRSRVLRVARASRGRARDRGQQRVLLRHEPAPAH